MTLVKDLKKKKKTFHIFKSQWKHLQTAQNTVGKKIPNYNTASFVNGKASKRAD